MVSFLKRLVPWLAAFVVALFWSSVLVLANLGIIVEKVDRASEATPVAVLIVGLIICLVVMPLLVYFLASWWSARSTAAGTCVLRLCLAVLSATPASYFFSCLFRHPVSLQLVALLCVPLGILWAFVLIAFLCRVHSVDRHAYWRTALLLGINVWLVLYLIKDEPARPPKYTWADIPTPTNFIDYYMVLNQVAQNKDLLLVPPSFKLEEYGVTNFTAEIENAWRAHADIHNAVDLLSAFDGTTNMFRQGVQYTTPVNAMVELYACYAQLKAAQGAYGEAVDVIVKIHSMLRRFARWSRILYDKIVWQDAISKSICTAYQVARHADIPDAELKKLQAAFTPLEPQEFSVKWAMVGEYLWWQDYLKKNRPEELRKLPYVSVPVIRYLTPLYFNWNATLNEAARWREEEIAAVDRVPISIQPLTPSKKQQGWHIKNPIGWIVLGEIDDIENPYPRQSERLKIQSDLLAMYLAARLHQQPTIPNYLAPGAYPIDPKTGLPFSPGFDGKTGTADDILIDKPGFYR